MTRNRYPMVLMVLGIGLAVVVVVCVVIFSSKSSGTSGSSSDTNATTSNATGSRANSTLQFMIVVSRHGNRAPLYWCADCPLKGSNASVWPYGTGQLSHVGHIQMYSMGVKLRSLYNGYLNQLYSPEDIKAYSTLVNRTMMTAALVLAGLFPPTGFEVWNTSIPWQPIPIFPCYVEHTKLVNAPQSCPKFEEAQNLSMITFNEEYAANVTSLVDYLEPYLGLSSDSTIGTLLSVWEPLICGDTEGYTLPTWADEVYYEPMASLIDAKFRADTVGSDTMIRLLQGLLFQEFVGLIETKINGTMSPDRSMFYYSGHDLTLIGLQGILGFHNQSLGMVRPSSAMIFELHQDPLTTDYYVEVLYIDGGTSDLEPTVISIPNCTSPCSFDTLKTLTQKYYNITDYTTECQLS